MPLKGLENAFKRPFDWGLISCEALLDFYKALTGTYKALIKHLWQLIRPPYKDIMALQGP